VAYISFDGAAWAGLIQAAARRSEVEKYYVSAGYLFPEYHGGYWIGLQVSAAHLTFDMPRCP
jgi:hypothetical protein